jgi:hypothetical protein
MPSVGARRSPTTLHPHADGRGAAEEDPGEALMFPGVTAEGGDRSGFFTGAARKTRYSTRRGEVSWSTRSKMARGSVLTFSFWRTTGTGITSAKPSGGALVVVLHERTVRCSTRMRTTWVALFQSLLSAPLTYKAAEGVGHSRRNRMRCGSVQAQEGLDRREHTFESPLYGERKNLPGSGDQRVGESPLFAAQGAAPRTEPASFSISVASAKSSALMPPASSVVKSTTTRSKTLDHSG